MTSVAAYGHRKSVCFLKSNDESDSGEVCHTLIKGDDSSSMLSKCRLQRALKRDIALENRSRAVPSATVI